MKIRSFKMVNSGTKGSIVEYNSNKSVNDLTFMNDFKERHMAPVPFDLKDKISKLKFHLLKISGHTKDLDEKFIDYDGLCLIKGDKDNKYFDLVDTFDRTEMQEIKFDGASFILMGTYNTYLGNKKVKIKTPLVYAEDEYAYFNEVCVLLKECFDMVKRYTAGDLAITPKQYVMDFNEHKGMTKEESNDLMEGMTDEEMTIFMKEKLESFGMIVLEDMNELIPMEEREITIVEPVSKKYKKEIEAVEEVPFDEEEDFVEPVSVADKKKVVKMSKVA